MVYLFLFLSFIFSDMSWTLWLLLLVCAIIDE